MTDEEQRLWLAYWQNASPEVETLLFSHYEPLVRMVRGRAFSGVDASYSMEAGDIDQEGSIGLLLAIRRFRPEMGRFETFANRYTWGKMMHGLKRAALTPAAAANRGERWQTVDLEEAEAVLITPPEISIRWTNIRLSVWAEFRVDRATLRALDRMARREQASRAWVVRGLLREALMG